MPHMETVSGPVVVMMLVACLLSVGFMVRFLLALTAEGKTIRAWYVRPEGVHYVAGTVCLEVPRRRTVLDSAPHLAIGVVRITTALGSDFALARQQAPPNRLHAVPPRANEELDLTAARRYRSG